MYEARLVAACQLVEVRNASARPRPLGESCSSRRPRSVESAVARLVRRSVPSAIWTHEFRVPANAVLHELEAQVVQLLVELLQLRALIDDLSHGVYDDVDVEERLLGLGLAVRVQDVEPIRKTLRAGSLIADHGPW